MGLPVPKRNRGLRGSDPGEQGARLAPDQGHQGVGLPRARTRVPARKKTPESKHGSGVPLKSLARF